MLEYLEQEQLAAVIIPNEEDDNCVAPAWLHRIANDLPDEINQLMRFGRVATDFDKDRIELKAGRVLNEGKGQLVRKAAVT